MRPLLTIDGETIGRNARAWAAFTGSPVRAVVKCEGYGWGYEPLVRALDDQVAGYCVADFEELTALRRHTSLPVVLLGAIEPDRLAAALDLAALPTISTARELEIAREWQQKTGKRLRLRVGVRPAAGWSGLNLGELEGLAPKLAASGAEVEVWTHVTDPSQDREQRARLGDGVALLERAGVRVVSSDSASTYSAAAGAIDGSFARIGVGLFGAGAAEVAGVACALRVAAPIVRIERGGAGTRVGYGRTFLARDEEIVVARCGYGDGLPKTLAGADDILSVGMQYVTARSSRCDKNRTQVVLIDGKSNLDAFAAKAHRLTHEIVTAFGNAARANDVSIEG
ncbi:MAG TPA: alanine racemase [Candidatus Baltobacteraceae bacterium]